ncbi:MAG TPA: ABC transporter ATP-binding protein, partial [Patescibacteria group bacterium]|nr:ABC transporter ATP-binding protein [Patescibacteria group bacterium]
MATETKTPTKQSPPTVKKKTAEKPLIEIKDLDVTYFRGRPNEVKALEDVSLEIYEGEFVIFFGPSGCGKSTLLYSISGLETNIAGDVIIDGKDISKMDKKEGENFHQKKIGMIFQAYYLINSLSILKNVILPQIAINADKEEREKRAYDLLEHFGVKEQADKLPSELSGGQKQRAAICRALVNEPDVLLADEPVGNLDSKSSDEVMKLLKELNDKRGKSVILVTHNPAHLNMAHRVFYLKDGKLIKTKINEAVNKEVEKKKEEREEKTSVSKDLEMLARSFSGISGVAGNLLIPFKAKEITSEVLSGMTAEEIDAVERKVENLLVTGVKGHSQNFMKYLDEPKEKGGMGMDKRTAEKLTDKVKDIIREIKELEREEREIQKEKSEVDRNKEARHIRHYLFDIFDYQVDD